ncbi:uncharacterized protein PHALS_15249 [Plasmopara halstedii]|uniref:Uncharacterized protein n=1 Tax=Plasmopara halstedii TaxID=4781 RepID=A0A0P1B731_PLAHL|nr:uncharacterized protein PHALS_15249 [Plasmopara halstedii]CEG49997.1 hypothetical protein PHALS_15249 [Plasmopara halstedii]|eukprot:XP_024586366.1 hypothetical protein PHALS_15249 [Plasmopara halstedii]
MRLPVSRRQKRRSRMKNRRYQKHGTISEWIRSSKFDSLCSAGLPGECIRLQMSNTTRFWQYVTFSA